MSLLPLRGVSDGPGRLPAEQFLSLCRTVPVLDVRSPSEFAQGHIPGARNLPLFSDSERAEVGTLYTEKGKHAAMLRGLAIAGPKLEALARGAFSFARDEDSPELAVYCWRGGMRSGSVAWLLRTAGARVHVLEGGYKTFRRYVLEFFSKPLELRVLGGKTGAGKTEALAAMRALGMRVVDLEGLARHRGSAFGAYSGVSQPSCEHFENTLAMALAAHGEAPIGAPIWVEDECENLGKVNLPRAFYAHLRASPLVLLETPENARLARVLDEYGGQSREEMGSALDRIKKRLGGLEHRKAHEALAAGDLPGVARLLLEYYDRAYAKQIAAREPVAIIRAESPREAAEIVQGLDCK